MAFVTDFQRLDEFALALMASAPLRRCACPVPAGRDCRASRCWACYTSLLEVVEWAHGNVADPNGQWLSRSYIRRALLQDDARWNAVRRGLLVRSPALEVRPATLEVRVRVEHVEAVCVICFEVMELAAQEHLPCMHAFHRGCIGTWLQTQRTCPICRTGF